MTTIFHEGLSLFGISIWSLVLPSFSQGKLSPGKPVGLPYGFGFLDATQVPEEDVSKVFEILVSK